MHWLLIGYMFLFIHRPFEVWPWLGELHVERLYVLFTLAVWAVAPGKRLVPNWQHAAYALFAMAMIAAWVLSPYGDAGQKTIEDYLKILVFYVLLVTCVSDERGLRRITIGFMAVMTIYLLHSFREYLSGRHTFRMGIVRMIGVDSTMSDPNTFGASIVFALPFVVCFWREGFGGRLGKLWLAGYFALSVLCILLTGSRSSLLGLIVWSMLTAFGIRRGWLMFMPMAMLAPAAFLALPESLQNRFETIINPEVGSEIARQSGEGRVQGFFTGLDLWQANPFTGVGPGAWRPATGSSIESHNLFGQLVGEMGTLGLIAFSALLCTFNINLWAIRKMRSDTPELASTMPALVAKAVGTAVLLLLVMGLFGHNLFRFTWLWYGGFLIIAKHVMVETRDALVEQDDVEEFELNAEWDYHAGHVQVRPMHVY